MTSLGSGGSVSPIVNVGTGDSFWDIVNNGLSVINTGANDYLNFIKTQNLNNVLTNPNTQAGQVYTVGQAQQQTNSLTSNLNLTYVIIGLVFLTVLIILISIKK